MWCDCIKASWPLYSNGKYSFAILKYILLILRKDVMIKIIEIEKKKKHISYSRASHDPIDATMPPVAKTPQFLP